MFSTKQNVHAWTRIGLCTYTQLIRDCAKDAVTGGAVTYPLLAKCRYWTCKQPDEQCCANMPT